MLALKLKNINEDITKLNQISGFKKRVTEYEKINKNIEEFSDHLIQLEKEINNIVIEKNNVDITDEEYHNNLQNLQEIIKIFDNSIDIEDQINLQKIIFNKIQDMEIYLNNRELEVNTIL